MRKLASIQKILSITSIEGADKIEACTINGWTIVIPKGKFKIGDKVVYCEIDSQLPLKLLKSEGLYDEAKKKGILSKKAGDVLSTKKFKGVLSQGLVIKITNPMIKLFKEDTDVSKYYGIKKYEKEIEVRESGIWKKFLYKYVYKKFPSLRPKNFTYEMTNPFPHFIPKTNETRVQNLTRNWNEMKTQMWIETEKMEGTSSTFYYKDEKEYGFCSRNLKLDKDRESYQKTINDRYSIVEKLQKAFEQHGLQFSIQGEIVGPGIQSNYYDLPELEFYLFNIYDIKNGKYLAFNTIKEILKDIGLQDLKLVPHKEFPITDLPTIGEILSQAEGKSAINPKKENEGKVYKPCPSNPFHSFKVISNKFLLKQD